MIRGIRKAALAAGLIALCGGTATAATALRGQIRTCRDYADLDHALERPGSDYFKGWTSSDFDAAQTWIAGCMPGTPSAQDEERKSQLASRRVALEATGEVQRNDVETRQHHEIEQRELDEQRLEDEKQQRLADERLRIGGEQQRDYDRCIHSNDYQQFVAASNVLDALTRESMARDTLRGEQRVEGLSGTSNAYLKHSAGESVVAAQDDEARWWSAYKRHGGTAVSPQGLSGTLRNPCE